MCAPFGAQENTTAMVHFYRYRQMQGSVLRPSVYMDGVQIARIENGRYYEIPVPAGEHMFYAEDKQAGAVVTLEPGKDYYFRTDLQIGFWKGHFRLTMVMPEQGKFDMAKLKPLDKSSPPLSTGGGGR
jgi:hypothetical protein